MAKNILTDGRAPEEKGLIETLGGWEGIGNLAGSSLLGFAGNALGTTLGGGISSLLSGGADVNDPMDDAKNMLDLKNQALVNTNAMGQRGREASLGVKLALDSFVPSATSVYDKGQSRSTADAITSNAYNQNDIAMRTAAQQQGNQQQQMMDVARMAGNSPAAMMAIARQGGAMASQGAGQLLGAMGQNTQSALSQASGMRQTASQIFEGAKQGEYNRNVVPYMNDYKDMSGLAIAGLNAGTQTSINAQQQSSKTTDGLSIDPLGYLNQAVGQTLGAQNTRNILSPGDVNINPQDNSLAPMNQQNFLQAMQEKYNNSGGMLTGKTFEQYLQGLNQNSRDSSSSLVGKRYY
jgi:hypothetical protein